MTKRIPNPTHPSGPDHWTRRTPEKIKRGPDASGAKLRDDDIDLICAFHLAGANHTALGRLMGVHRKTIFRHLRARGILER